LLILQLFGSTELSLDSAHDTFCVSCFYFLSVLPCRFFYGYITESFGIGEAVAIFDDEALLLNMQLAAILNHLRDWPPGVSVINEFAFMQGEKSNKILVNFQK